MSLVFVSKTAFSLQTDRTFLGRENIKSEEIKLTLILQIELIQKWSSAPLVTRIN